ncbi:P-loop containing nucleoside triphosphate hydrolase protein [Pleurotus eryngii]|uniref:P-loop containing nucleoside triphosphate hydrolase protein n=1 Tax=Pleurotus eryngii TaxID=5323 RepID=A0A9P5ZWX3_PLEER|nr:P-loop containing nucleoside triphosphate hydrolase protein [Pleurotus eryngii]
MRRTTTLEVDTASTTQPTTTVTIEHEDEQTAALPLTPTIQPSLKLLFSLLTRRQLLVFLLPAVIFAIISGGIAPFMTYVVGQAFDAFAKFPISLPTQQDKDNLLNGVGLAALQLLGLALASVALSSITSSLWIWTGEQNAMALRKKVYDEVVAKDMDWFDTKMGGDEQGPVGAGGLMAKFTRETDEVRMASSLASGMVLQYLTTTITCLVLAFQRSYQLTFVILSTVPLLTFIQGVSQATAGPLLSAEHGSIGIAGTLIDRAVSAIATVKAFNAQDFERLSLSKIFGNIHTIAKKLSTVWGITSGLSQFVMMSMFVQGFWFGSKLVREGKISPGDVMAVFWACLIATSNLQMCIPQFITLAKGKFAMVSLLTLIDETPSTPASPSSPNPPSPLSPASVQTSASRSTHTLSLSTSKPRVLRGIVPRRCIGEFQLADVTFSYPARAPVLKNVSLFLPAGETTFVVGGSGSGKSTVAALLLGLYKTSQGQVLMDEQEVTFLDNKWMRSHVMGVSQGDCVIFDGKTVHENIAAIMGTDASVSREQVIDACTKALLHEFINGLPDGYDTILGGASDSEAIEGTKVGGVNLSGGQRQRLAIARACLRDPTVLILDEATSALDPTSRLLVFEALKRVRRNKTTIVITHDLSQIENTDFVYVMRDGEVVEQGFRRDLESGSSTEDFTSSTTSLDGAHIGEFKSMLRIQLGMGGYLPERDIDDISSEGQTDEKRTTAFDESLPSTTDIPMPPPTAAARLRPLTLTLGNWMFDVVSDLTKTANGPGGALARLSMIPEHQQYEQNQRASIRASRFVPADMLQQPTQRKTRPTSIAIPSSPTTPTAAYTIPPTRRMSLQFTPTSPVFSLGDGYLSYSSADFAENASAMGSEIGLLGSRRGRAADYDDDETILEKRGTTAEEKRRQRVKSERRRWDTEKIAVAPKKGDKKRRFQVRVDKWKRKAEKEGTEEAAERQLSFWQLLRVVYPTIPYKPVVALGLATCVCSGAMTPIFSFLLSRVMFEVSIGATNVTAINTFGGIVLGIAAIDGFLLGFKYFLMETLASSWVTRIRDTAYERILAQDKKFFDKTDNASTRFIQILVKDGDDARNLLSVVIGQFLVVASMLGVGLVWALIRGWQLTLVGFAIAPVFAITMAVQTRLVTKCEVRNKRAREDVAKSYYSAIANIRGIRAMSFEGLYKQQFDTAADRALTTGVKGAFVEGCTYGVSSGLIYLAEALLFYVGAVLIAQGTYSYLQMVQTLNLVVFSVTIGSQLMAFTEKIAKAAQATRDFNELLRLPIDTDEAKGVMKPTLDGPVTFRNVAFSYPEHPDAPVLSNLNLSIEHGECVAIVGPSGCGKSTIAALLQRLYEPTSGMIAIGLNELRSMNAEHLRHHVSVVSQKANLFDATITENIKYGNESLTDMDVRQAAKAANVHEFIMTLPQGYDTLVGENASLISGGQAQRLQIARALARPARILILDECTSALDAANQAVVMDTIRSAKVGRTTIMVTHKVDVMRMCDRIVLVDEGRVVEEGRYDALMEKKGVFATLASGGEWQSA